MINKSQDKFIQECVNSSSWDKAIAEAKKQIGVAEEKIRRSMALDSQSKRLKKCAPKLNRFLTRKQNQARQKRRDTSAQ